MKSGIHAVADAAIRNTSNKDVEVSVALGSYAPLSTSNLLLNVSGALTRVVTDQQRLYNFTVAKNTTINKHLAVLVEIANQGDNAASGLNEHYVAIYWTAFRLPLPAKTQVEKEVDGKKVKEDVDVLIKGTKLPFLQAGKRLGDEQSVFLGNWSIPG